MTPRNEEERFKKTTTQVNQEDLTKRREGGRGREGEGEGEGGGGGEANTILTKCECCGSGVRDIFSSK